MRTLRRFIFLLMSVLPLPMLHAQVGINTEDPQGIFHVDALKNTDAASGTGISDDIVITSTGTGLGTLSPSATVDLRDSFKYVNGNQRRGYILQSDAGGNANWVPQIPRNFVRGVRTPAILSPFKSTIPIYMQTYITLPPGIWQITFRVTYSAEKEIVEANNMFWYLSTSSTVNTNEQRFVSCTSTGLRTNDYMQSVGIFLVSPTVGTTYYMWANSVKDVNLAHTGEFAFWAISIY